MYYKIALGIIALIFAFGYFTKEPEVIDRTEYFMQQMDSLENISQSLLKENQIYQSKIIDLRHKEDSLIQYQEKIYIYYAKEKLNVSHVPDSAFVRYFANLVRKPRN